jgi:beta-glucosidase
MGLFENPRRWEKEKVAERNRSPFSLAQAQKLAEESIVLVKNDGILPLDKSKLKKIALVGPNCDDAVQQLGDWTDDQDRNLTITILDGFKKAFPNVDYQKGCGILPGDKGDIPAAIAAIESSDAAIVVLGDKRPLYGEGRSTATLELQGQQHEFLDAILATKRKFILVMLASRPLIIPKNVRDAASAIIWLFPPGNMGGAALVRVVFGEVNPSGRLPISIPSCAGQLPVYHYQYRYWHGGYVDASTDPVWAFGYGIGYSQIEYLDAKLDKTTYKENEEIRVTIHVKNTGQYDADEVVQIYIHDLYASVTWVEQYLRGFKRVHIKAGETVTVEISIPVSECWVINAKEERVVEPGAFEARVGKASSKILFKLGFTVE